MRLTIFLFALTAFAQQPAPTPPAAMPADTVFAAGLWDQSSSPPLSAKLGYAHRMGASGTYSYTALSFRVQRIPTKLLTTQETGLCQYTGDSAGFHILLCGTAGVTESPSSASAVNVGFTPGGTILATRDMGRGWWIGVSPSVSKATTVKAVEYSIGLVIGWGK